MGKMSLVQHSLPAEVDGESRAAQGRIQVYAVFRQNVQVCDARSPSPTSLQSQCVMADVPTRPEQDVLLPMYAANVIMYPSQSSCRHLKTQEVFRKDLPAIVFDMRLCFMLCFICDCVLSDSSSQSSGASKEITAHPWQRALFCGTTLCAKGATACYRYSPTSSRRRGPACASAKIETVRELLLITRRFCTQE